NPLDTFDSILYFIKNLYQKANLVHGDLSEFNILYHNQEPIIIDISQAVSIHHPKSHFFLVRDIKNIFYYFEKIGVATPDPEEFYYEVIED
ncbi:MAG: serine protein kinase RIO, partial [Candidatus Lokiarchaeota archaeon]